MSKNYLMIDCESIGLYGDTFAVAAVFTSENGITMEEFHCACLNQEVLEKLNEIPFFVSGEGKDIVTECRKLNRVNSLEELRNEFWKFYMKCKKVTREYNDELDVYGDVIYPVETNFLAAVAKDDLEDRQFLMPYPLKDLSNYVDTSVNRIEEYIKANAYYILQDVASRKPVKHNPLWDARTSLWCLLNK